MADTSVPQEHQDTLHRIATFPPDVADELQRAFEDEQTAVLAEDLKASVAQHVTKVDAAFVDPLIETLLWLYAGVTALSVSRDTIVANVTQSDDLDISDELREVLAERLRRLLRTRAVTLAWKALDVLYANDNTFHGARITSEIRPVFDSDDLATPIAGMITHTLKIHYHDTRGHQDFFVTLDLVDIEVLQRALERAKKKQESLRSVLRASDIKYLGLTTEE